MTSLEQFYKIYNLLVIIQESVKHVKFLLETRAAEAKIADV